MNEKKMSKLERGGDIFLSDDYFQNISAEGLMHKDGEKTGSKEKMGL